MVKRFADRPLFERLAEAKKVSVRHPDGLPVVAHPAARSKFTDRKDIRIIGAPDMTLAAIYHTVRGKLELGPEEALFFNISDTMPALSATIAAIHEEFKNKEDNFLYITFCEENVYGA